MKKVILLIALICSLLSGSFVFAQNNTKINSNAGTDWSTNSYDWTFLGPVNTPLYGNNSNVKYSGRIYDIRFKNNFNGFRLAAARGGVWEENGNGIVNCLVSDEWGGVSCIGSFDIQPGNNDVMVSGTGAPAEYTSSGFLFTTNGGVNWLGSLFIPDWYQVDYVYKVRFETIHPNIVHAATSNGYFRSTDSGIHWSLVEIHNNNDKVTDVLVDQNSNYLIYTVLTGARGGVYMSINEGVSWTKCRSGIDTSNVGRGSITKCTASPAVTYCLLSKNSDNTLLGVYKSTSGGLDWNKLALPSAMNNIFGQDSLGWFSCVISVSPSNPNLVIAAGVNAFRSTDGGVSWTKINDAHVHDNIHSIVWNEHQPGSVLLASDGGVSNSTDDGLTWHNTYNNIPIAMYNHLAVSNDGVKIFGGTEDIGISGTTNGGSNWFCYRSGETGSMAIDPANSSIIYAVQNGIPKLIRSVDNGITWTGMNNNIGSISDDYSDIRLRTDKTKPNVVFTNANNTIFKSTNAGINWIRIGSYFGAGKISEFTVTTTNSPYDLFYICIKGSSTGDRLKVIENGNMFERGNGLPDKDVRKVVPDPSNSMVAYALIDISYYFSPSIFKTTDRGNSWIDLSHGTFGPETIDLMPHPLYPYILIAGTTIGFSISYDNGWSWHDFNGGFPMSGNISELTYVDSLSTSGRFYIIASVNGRGIYSREITGLGIWDSPLSAINQTGVPKKFKLKQNYPDPFNPETTIKFDIAKTSHVKITIFDIEGKSVQTLINKNMEPGSYDVKWNGENFSSGVYFYRIEADNFVDVRKMILIK